MDQRSMGKIAFYRPILLACLGFTFFGCVKESQYSNLRSLKSKITNQNDLEIIEEIDSNLEKEDSGHLHFYLLLLRSEVEAKHQLFSKSESSLDSAQKIIGNEPTFQGILCDRTVLLIEELSKQKSYQECYRLLDKWDRCNQDRNALVRDYIYKLEHSDSHLLIH